MAHRVQYLIRFLEERNVNIKIFDLSFRHENESIYKFLKNILLFPSRSSASSNRILYFPSMPSLGSNHNNLIAFMHFMFSFLDFFLIKLISKSLDYNVVVATDPISAFVAQPLRRNQKLFLFMKILIFLKICNPGRQGANLFPYWKRLL